MTSVSRDLLAENEKLQNLAAQINRPAQNVNYTRSSHLFKQCKYSLHIQVLFYFLLYTLLNGFSYFKNTYFHSILIVKREAHTNTVLVITQSGHQKQNMFLCGGYRFCKQQFRSFTNCS